MKILQINCVYAIGSTGKIVEDISAYCMENGDVVLNLFGRQGKRLNSSVIKISSELEAKVHSILSRLTGVEFGYSYFATKRAVEIIKSYKPDVVHLHCLNGHFINVFNLLNYLKENNIPTVLTLHAEIMHTAGCEHAYECTKWIKGCYKCDVVKGKITCHLRDDAEYSYKKMQEAFDGFTNLTVVGVSDWLTNRAKRSAIFKNAQSDFITIENGLDLKSFSPTKLMDNPLKCEFDNESPIILHVTPNFQHPLKGGKYVLELAEKHPEWTFIIVGYNGEENLPPNVRVVSHVHSKKELSYYYSLASVTLLTSKRETFSMVCAESLACGTPVVGFEAGGPESVFIGDVATFVTHGDISKLESAVQDMLLRKPMVNTASINERFASSKMAQRYKDIYENIKR